MTSDLLAGAGPNPQPRGEHATEHTGFYQYSPIDSTNGAIRLLVLRGGTGHDIDCDLIDSTLDGHGLPYEAVSYTWGPEYTSDSIKIHGKKLPVNFHLSLILRDLRSPDESRIIWIDAVCINQKDAAEKGHQVAQMANVYRFAKCVLFCICRPTDYTNLLMDSLQGLSSDLCETASSDSNDLSDAWLNVQTDIARQHLDDQSPHYQESLQRQVETMTVLQRQGLEYLLNQPWFLRVWILQEVANASSAVVYCGRRSVSAVVFAHSPQLLNVQIPFGQDGIVAQVLGLMPGPTKRDVSQELYPLLQRFRGSLATTERDKIYALFGICQDVHIAQYLQPNYIESDRHSILRTISYICRVEVSAIANTHFSSIGDFLCKLDHLDNSILSHLLTAEDYRSASSILGHRGEHISVTPDMLTLASTKKMMEGGVMALLLQHRDADVLFSDWNGWYATRIAAETGHDSLADSMIRKIEDIESTQNKQKQTRLSLAAEDGNINLVRLLLQIGANIEAKNFRDESPFIIAAKNGHTTTVQLLIDKGADVTSQGKEKRIALYYAAEQGKEAIVRLLLEQGADPWVEDMYGVTSLEVAATNGHDGIIWLLLANDANGNDQRGWSLDRTTSKCDPLNLYLLFEAEKCHPSTQNLLFEAGARAGRQTLSFRLEQIVHPSNSMRTENRHDQELLVRMLLEHGAESSSALCMAASYGSNTIIQHLLDFGAGKNINRSDQDPDEEGAWTFNGTPLIWATIGRHADTVKLLLDNGASLEARGTALGSPTALGYAAAMRNKEIVEILVNVGAEIDASCRSDIALLIEGGTDANVAGDVQSSET